MEDFEQLVDFLKGMADKAKAGKAWVEWTFEDGGTLRVEYKPTERRAK